MSSRANSVPADVASASLTRERIGWLASIAFFAILPAVVLVAAASALGGDTLAFDLRQFYDAAHAVLDGDSPYPRDGEPANAVGALYPYPPLPALLAVPLAPLPFAVAGWLVTVVLVGVALPSCGRSACGTGGATASLSCGLRSSPPSRPPT